MRADIKLATYSEQLTLIKNYSSDPYVQLRNIIIKLTYVNSEI